MRKFLALLLLGVLVFGLSGAAFAEDVVYLRIRHDTNILSVDGYPHDVSFHEYGPNVVAYSKDGESLEWAPKGITFNFKEPGVLLTYDDDGEDVPAEEVAGPARKTFEVYQQSSYGAYFDIGDDKHRDVYFGFVSDAYIDAYADAGGVSKAEAERLKKLKYRKDTETALEGQSFNITLDNGKVVDGSFPTKILTTEEQIKNGYVPELETVTSGGKITGVKWRFVNPSKPGVALTRPAEGVRWVPYLVRQLYIRLVDGSRETIFNENELVNFYLPGDKLEGSCDLPTPFDAGALEQLSITYQLASDDEGTENIDFAYEWSFHYQMENFEKDVIVPEPAPQDTPDAVKDATGITTDAEPVKEASISTRDRVFVDGSSVDSNIKADTISAIAVSQNVTTPGDAVILPAGIEFPLIGKYLLVDNKNTPPEAKTWSELVKSYQVRKSFDGASWVDLLKLYPTEGDLFSLGSSSVKLLATLVIVDDKAPSGSDIKRPSFGGEQYGVKLVTSGSAKYLIVYDGVKNGTAKDPILLTADSDGGKDGGSGGCSAGWGAAALLIAVGLAFRRRG
ncbi:hypothetical protein FACS1894204_12500 [Synergistales bacterium]|nr:hypothetical protein FACS1894204_12500 [Synergistales bacterium]